MNTRLRAQTCGFLAWLALLGCGAPPGPVAGRFPVEISVASDDGKRLPGARLRRAAQPLGATDENGNLRVELAGTEGQTTALELSCPTGFLPEKPSLPVRLARTRRVGAKTAEPQRITATCLEQTREVVLIVHESGGGQLPIRVGGLDAGATDADGNAHILLRIDRKLRTLDVVLDTRKRGELVPADPSKVFDLDGRDALLLFEQPFTARRPRAVAASAPAPRRHVPTRID
jgi:hypothetical protein